MWVSVKDRLPEHNKRIVMRCKYYDYICVGMYAANGVWYEISDGNQCLTNHTVDYWMPLPEPPESEDDKGKAYEE